MPARRSGPLSSESEDDMQRGTLRVPRTFGQRGAGASRLGRVPAERLLRSQLSRSVVRAHPPKPTNATNRTMTDAPNARSEQERIRRVVLIAVVSAVTLL